LIFALRAVSVVKVGFGKFDKNKNIPVEKDVFDVN
jgi:hypothetical protein